MTNVVAQSKKFPTGPFEQTPRTPKLNMGPRAPLQKKKLKLRGRERARGPKLNLRLARGLFKRSCLKFLGLKHQKSESLFIIIQRLRSMRTMSPSLHHHYLAVQFCNLRTLPLPCGNSRNLAEPSRKKGFCESAMRYAKSNIKNTLKSSKQ